MKKLMPQTIEGVRKKKELFMRLLTNAQRQVEGHKKVINECDRLVARILEKDKRKKRRLRFFPAFLVLLCLCLALSGCHVGVGVGADASAYWPKIKTAKGGKFGDPDESRKQTTQHTVGMARNNEFKLPTLRLRRGK